MQHRPSLNTVAQLVKIFPALNETRVHDGLPLDPILVQINLFPTFLSYYFNHQLQSIGLQACSGSTGFPPLPSPSYVPFPYWFSVQDEFRHYIIFRYFNIP
jgi:hypothetical protein